MVLKLFNYFGLIALLSYGVFVFFGFGELNWWNAAPTLNSVPAKLAPFYGSYFTPTPPEAVDHMFRGDIRRSGFFDQAVPLRLKPKNLTPLTNLGIHSASKSSALDLNGDILAATDTGRLARLSSEGRILWEFRTTKALEGFHGTPATRHGMIVFGDYSGLVAALESTTGRLIWGLPLGHAVGASPLITPDDKILISVELNRPRNGFIAKVNLFDGTIEWVSKYLEEQGHSSPALHWDAQSPENSLVIFGDNSHRLSALNYTTGQLRWRTTTGGPIKATPALYNDQIFISSWDGFFYSVQVSSGEVLWKIPFEKGNQSSAAILGELNFGYISSKKGLCRFHLKNKAPLVCTDVPNGSGARKSSPIITRSIPGQVHGGYIVWVPCKSENICAYDSELKLLKEWTAGADSSGEIRPYKKGVMSMTQGDSGLFILSPE